MSEPMTAVEIEDVLSSIRRLVSEDLRPTHKLVSAALEKSASKLILTPALRIVSDDRRALPELADGSDEPRDLRSVLQSIETDEPGETAEIVPVFGSVRQQDQVERPEHDWHDQAEGSASDANFLTTAMSRINGLASANDNVDVAGQADKIETVVAVVGAAVGPEEWEPDGGEPAPQEKAWSDTVWNSAEAVDDVVQQDQDATVVFDAVAGAEQVYGDEVMAETGVVFETVTYDVQADTVVAAASEDSAVDLGGQDSIVFADTDAEQIENLGVDAAVSQPSADDFDDTAGYLSEDLLREVVRDMIRAELQGDLGERITRNVRKLVRAEISRALAARDFE